MNPQDIQMNPLSVDIPSHVPADLVKDFPLTDMNNRFVNPHSKLVPEIHNYPPIFYARNALPIHPGGAWVVTKASDIKMLFEDNEHFIKKGGHRYASMIGEKWDAIPTELDPPKHTSFRKTLDFVFSPKKIAEMEERIKNRANHLITSFRSLGEVDLVREFTIKFPVSITLDLLGLPQSRMDDFLKWEENLLRPINMDDRRDSILALRNLIMDEIEKRKRNPGDDLISGALDLRTDGRPWTDQEILGYIFTVFTGGLDTVTSVLGFIFHHLATHVDDQKILRDDPAKIEQSVLEFMRAFATVTVFRICSRELNIHGVHIKPGDQVALSTPLASNDPGLFPEPQKLILDRRPAHLSFGYGIHRCLGAHLARRELKVAIESMLDLVPEFQLKPGFKVPYMLSYALHVQKLPVIWKI